MANLEHRDNPGPSVFPLDKQYISSLGSVVKSSPRRFLYKRAGPIIADLFGTNSFLAHAVISKRSSYLPQWATSVHQANAVLLGNLFVYDAVRETARRRGVQVPLATPDILAEYDKLSGEKEIQVLLEEPDMERRISKMIDAQLERFRATGGELAAELRGMDLSTLAEDSDSATANDYSIDLTDLAELGAAMIYDPLFLAKHPPADQTQ